MKHELKEIPKWFEPAWDRKMNFVISAAARNFQVNDEFILREWDLETEGYTGRQIEGVITYITDFYQKPDAVVFAFEIKKLIEIGFSVDLRVIEPDPKPA